MSLFVPPRRPSREILDDPSISSEEMARSLADLWLVNRSWGGSRALARRVLERAGTSPARRLLLLDIGAGSGHVARRLARCLKLAGLDAAVIAADLQWRHLAAGRRMLAKDSPPAVSTDAFLLPFADRSVDWVVSTLFFHHFSPEENIRLLKSFARVARRGFLLLDLRRHRLPLLFVSLAGRLLFRSDASAKDGVASVRQAYTSLEASAIAQQAVTGAGVERVFPFRLLISGPAA